MKIKTFDSFHPFKGTFMQLRYNSFFMQSIKSYLLLEIIFLYSERFVRIECSRKVHLLRDALIVFFSLELYTVLTFLLVFTFELILTTFAFDF